MTSAAFAVLEFLTVSVSSWNLTYLRGKKKKETIYILNFMASQDQNIFIKNSATKFNYG